MMAPLRDPLGHRYILPERRLPMARLPRPGHLKWHPDLALSLTWAMESPCTLNSPVSPVSPPLLLVPSLPSPAHQAHLPYRMCPLPIKAPPTTNPRSPMDYPRTMDYPQAMDCPQVMDSPRTMDSPPTTDFPSTMDTPPLKVSLSSPHLRSAKVLLRKHR
jgi:hypothetical protein